MPNSLRATGQGPRDDSHTCWPGHDSGHKLAFSSRRPDGAVEMLRVAALPLPRVHGILGFIERLTGFIGSGLCMSSRCSCGRVCIWKTALCTSRDTLQTPQWNDRGSRRLMAKGLSDLVLGTSIVLFRAAVHLRNPTFRCAGSRYLPRQGAASGRQDEGGWTGPWSWIVCMLQAVPSPDELQRISKIPRRRWMAR